MSELPTCPYCDKQPVSIGRNGKPNRTCGGRACVRQSTSQSAAKLSIWSTSVMDKVPTGFEPTQKTKTAVVAGTTVTMRLYRNPDGISLWSSSPPTEQQRAQVR